MKRIHTIADKVSNILTPARAAAALGIFFALTLLPILYVAPAVRATGDDLGYSAAVHQALISGGGFAGVLSAIRSAVVGTWYSWQGTWSSVALFCLQPGIWGDAWYPLTVAVSLGSILGGTWYFLNTILKRIGFAAPFRWIAYFLTAVMVIQYMPYPRGGIYWWTSVAHYDISYLAALLVMGWSFRWLDTGKQRYFIGITLLMTYLGGAGYPALVLAAVWIFLMIVGGMTGLLSPAGPESSTAVPTGGASDAANHRDFGNAPGTSFDRTSGTNPESCSRDKTTIVRSLLLLLPLVLEMIGFVISAIAPGNSNRGGEGFGFSVSNVIYTLLICVKEGFTEGVGYFLTARPLILVLIVIAVYAWETAPRMEVRDEKGRLRIEQPILAVLPGFGITCIVRAPEIYAATEVSGGVTDTYWFVTMTALTVCVSYVCAWARNLKETAEVSENAPIDEESRGSAAAPGAAPSGTAEAGGAPTDRGSSADRGLSADRGALAGPADSGALPQHTPRRSGVVVLAAALICLVLSRYMVGATVDYTCVTFVASGAYDDYRVQMAEWLEILNDPEITDAELPAMNDEQGPFMLMVPTENPDDVTSADYSNYYGKNSVIMVERE